MSIIKTRVDGDLNLAHVLTWMTGTLLSGPGCIISSRNPTHLGGSIREVREEEENGTLTFEGLAGLKYLNACTYSHVLTIGIT